MPYTTACSCVTSGTRYKHKKNDTGNNTQSLQKWPRSVCTEEGTKFSRDPLWGVLILTKKRLTYWFLFSKELYSKYSCFRGWWWGSYFQNKIVVNWSCSIVDINEEWRTKVLHFIDFLMEHFLEGIALFRTWYINPNEKRIQFFPFDLTYQSINWSLPSKEMSHN